MDILPMRIANAFRIVPRKFDDNRGAFFEAVRRGALSEAIGYPFEVAQVNYSVSRRNTLRGIHGTMLLPGQAKLVTCVQGAVLDIAVDMRVGSPTFGHHEVTHQDESSGVSVYLADGFGHAFLALTETARMSYLCSTEYVPGTMIDVNPLDPDLDLPWPLSDPPILSEKDAQAPTLAEAGRIGLLPSYQNCLAHYRNLRDKSIHSGQALLVDD